MNDRSPETTGAAASRLALWALRIYALILVGIGLPLAIAGGYLVSLGGSPYYVLCGIAVTVAGVLLWLRRQDGALLYGAMLLATVIWAAWEAGAQPWALMPRLVAPFVLGVPLLIGCLRRVLIPSRYNPTWLQSAGLLGIAIVLGILLRTALPPYLPADPIYQMGVAEARQAAAPAPQAGDGDWLHFTNDPGGSHYSPLAQIDAGNVARLEVAWTAQVDVLPRSHANETTPLKVGDRVYLCSSDNDLMALDAETGKMIWRHDVHASIASVVAIKCRGIVYYKQPGAAGACAERLITNTVDARLIAVDAQTGRSCEAFGEGGQVSLLAGMSKAPAGYYLTTSAPTLVRGKVVVGGWVTDNQAVGEPSGVIRAYDAVTGALAWAWDMGRPDRTGLPAAGETYTPGTANAWGPMSADESLGLVYAGLGNPTPDYYGKLRRPYDEQYGSSIVALDAVTGRPRWHFQTAHHDLWDYDVSAQPALVDYPGPQGMVKAVIQATKRGELFVLDRATGRPVKPVREHAVPTDGGIEKLSPTQPYSDAMPSFRGADLVEGDMWGITPLDQLWCRVKFREARYEPAFTPLNVTPSIVTPGKIGGINWGGVAFDRQRQIVIVNSTLLPNHDRLIPRKAALASGLRAQRAGEGEGKFPQSLYAQEGTPYGVASPMFLSPLKVPCTRPPYGRISAVDLGTGKLIWSRPLGTARGIGPMGMRSGLPFAVGTVNRGAAVVTGSGLTFISSGPDNGFVAYDTRTGKPLWQARLPAEATSIPMTYISPKSGRQFVVVSVGGQRIAEGFADKLVAFALPK